LRDGRVKQLGAQSGASIDGVLRRHGKQKSGGKTRLPLGALAIVTLESYIEVIDQAFFLERLA
jgi:hypothetical protein